MTFITKYYYYILNIINFKTRKNLINYLKNSLIYIKSSNYKISARL